MQHILNTVDDVIDALGGTSSVARITGRTPKAVSNWRARQKLPSNTFLLISAELASKDKATVPAVWGMAERVSA